MCVCLLYISLNRLVICVARIYTFSLFHASFLRIISRHISYCLYIFIMYVKRERETDVWGSLLDVDRLRALVRLRVGDVGGRIDALRPVRVGMRRRAGPVAGRLGRRRRIAVQRRLDVMLRRDAARMLAGRRQILVEVLLGHGRRVAGLRVHRRGARRSLQTVAIVLA